MPRHVKHLEVVRSIAPSVRRVNLRSFPRADADVANPTNIIMREKRASTEIPREDLFRTRYGRALNLDRIESALRSADYGAMRQLTDLARETIDTDPHLASVLNKRIGAISALPWEVVPASGFGIDEERARFYAEVVRDQLEQLAGFNQRLRQLAWGLFDGRAALENVWTSIPNEPGVPKLVHPTFGQVLWVIRDLGWVHPRRLTFGPHRELRLNDTDVGNFSPSGLALDETRGKFIQFVPQLFGEYPEREGLARRCLYWSFFKRFGARERMMLLELFGKPWRWLEVEEESTASAEDLEQADDMLTQLGGSASFRFPRGTKVNMTQPGQGAGQIHQQVIDDSDKQLSKLVLGQTGTTDTASTGLNSQQANVMQDEQYMLLTQDAKLISDSVETQLTDIIIEMNFGGGALSHAPSFVLRADVPLDRVKELARLKAAIDAGLEVAVDEAYKISGFRRPKASETVVRFDVPPVHPLAVQPDPPRPIIAFPVGATNLPERKIQGLAIVDAPTVAQKPAGANQPGEPVAAPVEPVVDIPVLALAPADIAKVVTVNEARESQRLGPLLAPDGSKDPDGFLTVAAFDAKQRRADAAAAIESGVVAPPNQPGATTDAPPTLAKHPDIVAFLSTAHPSDLGVLHALLTDHAPGCDCGCGRVSLEAFALEDAPGAHLPTEVRTAEQPSDGKHIGSIETVVAKGVTEGARFSYAMTQHYVNAVIGLTDGEDIANALDAAADEMDLHPFSRSLERRMMHSAMTGAVASAFEVQTGLQLPVAKFAAVGDTPFVSKPFADAVKWFRSLNVITRAGFDQLDAAAKRRSFTVAGLLSKRQLLVAKNELDSALRSGARLDEFSDKLSARFEAAGFTPMNPSHVETVYRTNMVNAYSSGRQRQMTQPSVAKLNPFWKIVTVNDGPPRQRKTHADVSEWVISMDDPIWQTAYPPFGFNCRCRVIAVPASIVKERSLRVRTGLDVGNTLPDPGFTSGTGSLL